MAVCPCRPAAGEVLQQQVGECLAVVGDDACGGVGAFLRQELGQVFLQLVAAAFVELVEEPLRPVRLVDFVGVVEDVVREGGSGERFVKLCQVAVHGMRREVVEHVALPSGSCPLHLLPGLPAEGGYQPPFALRCVPGEGSLTDVGSQVEALSAVRECHQAFQHGVRLLLGIVHTDGHLHMLASSHPVFGDDELTGRILHGHFRSAEGPACPVVHVDLHAQLLRQRQGIIVHPHPCGREIGTLVALVPLYAVDGRNLDRPDAGTGILPQVVSQVDRVDGASHPPPAGAGLHLGRHGGPSRLLCPQRSGAADAQSRGEHMSHCNSFHSLVLFMDSTSAKSGTAAGHPPRQSGVWRKVNQLFFILRGSALAARPPLRR